MQYLNSNIKHIRECLDGKNAELVFAELGIKFHRIIYEHLLQFTYNSAGKNSYLISLFITNTVFKKKKTYFSRSNVCNM